MLNSTLVELFPEIDGSSDIVPLTYTLWEASIHSDCSMETSRLRPGTAPSMPTLAEVEALLARSA